MTRSRLLSGILIGLFVIALIVLGLFFTSGLAGNTAKTPATSPSPYLLETSASPTY